MNELDDAIRDGLVAYLTARSTRMTDAENHVAEAILKLLTLAQLYRQLQTRKVPGGYDPILLDGMRSQLGLPKTRRVGEPLVLHLLRQGEFQDLPPSTTSAEISHGLAAWEFRIRNLDVRAWLFQTVRNQSADEFRSAEAKRTFLLSDPATLEQIGEPSDRAATDFVSDMKGDLRFRRLEASRDCLEELSATDRGLLKGKEMEGRSYEDLAREFGLTYDAVGPRLTRARKAVKLCVEGKVAN